MNILFDKWKTKIPKYNEVYKVSIFETLSVLGGSTEKSRYNRGRYFSSNYELYMYAFFLGLYNNEFKPLDKTIKKTDFSHAIQFWGNKSNRAGREEFSNLQEYMFAAAIAKTDISLIDLDKGLVTEEEITQQLVETVEAYTNGGLMMISEKLEESPNYFLQAPSFLSLLVESVPAGD